MNDRVAAENPDGYETILYALLDMGINNVHNVSFTTSELRRHRDAARLAAVRAAREKAELLAGAAGISLGKAANIQEGRYSGLPAYREQPSRSQSVLASSSPAPAADAEEGFALGMITVKAEVTVAYELE